MEQGLTYRGHDKYGTGWVAVKTGWWGGWEDATQIWQLFTWVLISFTVGI